MVNNQKSSYELDQKVLLVPLKESGEEMVDLEKLNIRIIFNKKGGLKKWFLRKSVAVKLQQAAMEFFNKGYLLCLMDAYRSLEEQEKLFIKQINLIKMSKPNLDLMEVKKQANTYIAGVPVLAAHTCGAAVDVILTVKNTGKVLDMGCKYLTLNSKAITDSEKISKKQAENRMILKNIMDKHGFTNYPYEYWHYSIGDSFAAYSKKEKYAIYGPVKFDFIKNVMTLPKSKKYLFDFFKVS